MKKLFLSIVMFGCLLAAQAQGTWSPYASVEENVHYTDIDAAFNYPNLQLMAANSGIRLGGYYTYDDQLSGEITLGVTGIGTPGTFSRKIVPMEFIAHYNMISPKEGAFISKFNLSAGVGSGLAESSNGRFGFSEHTVLGANMEMKDLLPFGTLIMGTRYTMFVDDYIDGTSVDGSTNDAVLRFYTAVRLDGIPKKAREAMAEAEAKAAKFQADAKAAEEKNETLKKKMDAAAKAHDEEVAQLTDALSACKDSLNNENDTEQVVNSSNLKGYYVIVGSLPSEELALKHMSRLGLSDLQIIHMKDLNTYRVVYSKHDNKTDAVNSRRKARSIRRDAWIAVY